MDGGCLCGRVRYRAGNDPYDAVACHCDRCRKATGAPFVVWVSFHKDHFAYTAEMPAEYESSAGVFRSFCKHCGTSLANHHTDRKDEIVVNVCSLDDPSSVVPEKHIWVSRRLPWIDMDGVIPRCDGPG